MTYVITLATSDHLEQIIKIWGANRGTLGLMPRAAFEDCIRKKWVLVCVNNEHEVVGYLQFRFTNRTQTLSIVHLCVDVPHRGNSLSEKLVDKLVAIYKTKARGIKLNCRSDYTQAIHFWQRYNFQPKGERPSRGNDPSVHLITWWFSFGGADLFSFTNNDKIKAVLDCNIIAKLRDKEHSATSSAEVRQLYDDWLADEVDYYFASETVSEIFRDPDQERKKRSLQFLKGLTELNIDKPSINQLEKELIWVIAGTTDNDRSDRRQLAESVLSGFPYFITLDEGILKHKQKIEANYQLKVLDPTGFILGIDSTINAADYYPARLSANRFTVGKVNAAERDQLADCFLNHAVGEKRHQFLFTLNQVAQKGELKAIKEGDTIVSAIGSHEDGNKLIVSVLRTKQDALRQTLFMQNVSDLIIRANGKQKELLIIKEQHLSDIEKSILESYHFYPLASGEYIRGISRGLIDIKSLETALSKITAEIGDLRPLITDIQSSRFEEKTFLQAYNLEKKLWPLKIVDANIPCFIVPIKPEFGRELFDSYASQNDLYGSAPTLIWNKENVYYRNVKPDVETFPARILWYASCNEKQYRQKAIISSSYLDEVLVGPAKETFKRFEKYGIYSWDNHIKPLTKGEVDKPIKILRFSDSESFSSPVSLKKIKSILKQHSERDNNFQSPLRISPKTFIDLYLLGKKQGQE